MKVAEFFQMLSDPTRLRVLNVLARGRGKLCVCELTEILNLPQSTISRQLRPLRHLGIVSTQRTGRWVHYFLAFPYQDYVRMLIEEYPVDRSQLEDDLARLEEMKVCDGCVRPSQPRRGNSQASRRRVIA